MENNEAKDDRATKQLPQSKRADKYNRSASRAVRLARAHRGWKKRGGHF
jgi:hypothetical protein